MRNKEVTMIEEVAVSKINTLITTSYLRRKPEHQYFERKGLYDKHIKPTKIAEELIGMLNADGGVLVFGISDNGELQNLRSIEDQLAKYRSLVFEFIHPACNICLEEIEVEGNLLFLYHVEQEIERTFSRKDNENIYLRVNDTNRLLDRDAVKNLEYDKQIRRFEEEFQADFDFEDCDDKLLAQYKEKLNYQGSELDLLCKRYLATRKDGAYRIKKAGVLLFSKDPEKYIPSASVRYIRYDGKEAKTGVELNVIKDERFENNIPGLIDELKIFLNASFKDYYFLDIVVGKFRKVPEYPGEAWLEGVVNALCHRSYNVQGNAIYIKHFDDRLEIGNSGPLPAQVTVENIKTERYARNPRVTRVLEDMGYVRQLNEGVSRIYESMEKSMLSIPEYKLENGNVYLTLRNKISEHSKTISDVAIMKIEKGWNSYNDTQRSIFQYLFVKHKATVGEFSRHVGINENTIRDYLKQFIADKIIIRLSEKQRDKNALFVFKKH